MEDSGIKSKQMRALRAICTDNFEKALSENLQALEKKAIESIDISSVKNPTLYCIGELHGSHVYASPKDVLPGTGGLLLRLPDVIGQDLFLDPGWGSFAAAMRLGIPISLVGIILISHCHIDHIGDLHSLLLYLKFRRIKPVLIANNTSIYGSIGQPSILPEYFLSLCDRVIVPDEEKNQVIDSIHIFAFRTGHRENPRVFGESLGFIVSIREPVNRSIAFITDGPLDSPSPVLLERLRKCQTLVVNLGTISALPKSISHNRIFDNSLCTSGLELLLKSISEEPNQINKICLTHLGAEVFISENAYMKQILESEGYETPIQLLESAARALLDQMVGSDVELNILREGNRITI